MLVTISQNVPHGKTGKNFIDKLTQHINDWNNGSEMQHIVLKAGIVLLAVGLQKSARNLRHRSTKSFWLKDWHCGERAKYMS